MLFVWQNKISSSSSLYAGKNMADTAAKWLLIQTLKGPLVLSRNLKT